MALSLRNTSNPSMETLGVNQMNISLGSLAGIPAVELLAIFGAELIVVNRTKAVLCAVVHIRNVCNIRLHTELIVEHKEILRAVIFIPSPLLHSTM